MSSKVTKAVIPAAGLGTRFLPLTKAQPKEMLPVVNKPTIQWVIEEAVEAGITDIAIITGKNKKVIENHFSSLKNLEVLLEKNEKFEELEKVKAVNSIANLTFIVQEHPKGLGHAIYCSKDFIGDQPFAVLLGDTICIGSPNCTKGLIDIFEKRNSSVFSVEEIKIEETDRYGIVSGQTIEEGLILVEKLVEKPGPELAPSLLGIQGRYVFTSELFDYLNKTGLGKEGEMQLTDAMQFFAEKSEIYSWIFNGKRYDIGTMKDWFQSHIELSFQSEYSEILKQVVNKL